MLLCLIGFFCHNSRLEKVLGLFMRICIVKWIRYKNNPKYRGERGKNMDKNLIGYARVSSLSQNDGRQIIALMEYGVPKSRIYSDHQSGKDFERENYKRMLKRLKKGDILVIKSIDRLGRSYKDVIKQWQYITQEKGADIIVLDMPILNTISCPNRNPIRTAD